MHRPIIVLLVALSLGLTACASKPPKPAPVAPSADEGAQGEGAMNPNASGRGIYFDFDSSEIKGEGTDVVAAHAKYLAANAATRVRLEGHTDERGSREYNIGLGERRAQAVRRALLLQGAADRQISTVSYGEERPAVPGHDEAAWAKNRRVEIVYLAVAPVAPAKRP